MQALESLFTKALQLEPSWMVTKLEFDEGGGIIRVFIDFPRGSMFSCPACGKPVKAYDTTEKEWRHLSFFQYACYLVVRVPRIDCPDDGILQIDVPWAREGADFTFLFESFAMTLVREMPVNRVSQIINVDDNKLWRMMHYYTEAARRVEDYSGVKQLGVDETSKAKGHDYVSLFVDLEKRRTIFVAEGKGSETMTAFAGDFTEHHGNKEESREGFEGTLKKWYFWATHSRIDPIKEAAKTIKRHWSGVLRWYDSKINNGILEGLNSLVQAAKAKARGYRAFKNLKTMIYMLTGKLDYSKTGLPT